MNISIKNLKNAEKLATEFEAFRMYQSERLEVVHICLKPNESIPLHKNPVRVVFCILQGSGILVTEEGKSVVSPFDSIEILENTSRSLENPGETELRVLVLKQIN
ncbi:MAG: cupin domain-containing protein [Bacteroidales bacterium]|nr:cupin domain-containing protein [Bacteroidales bacterium]